MDLALMRIPPWPLVVGPGNQGEAGEGQWSWPWGEAVEVVRSPQGPGAILRLKPQDFLMGAT